MQYLNAAIKRQKTDRKKADVSGTRPFFACSLQKNMLFCKKNWVFLPFYKTQLGSAGRRHGFIQFLAGEKGN